jgi:hypothetical protein
MNIGTTSIDSLPVSPQVGPQMGHNNGENIRMDTYDQNIKVPNPAQALQQERDNDPATMQKNLNQFVTGIQQASAAGMTTLPSRDIPQNQQHLSQDIHVQPNYIPQPPQNQLDYIRAEQTNDEIIRAQAQKQEKKKSFDIWYDELQTPVLIGILFFLFQLPVIQKQMCRLLPSLFNKDGNPSLSGYIFTSASFAGVYYFLVKSMHFLER